MEQSQNNTELRKHNYCPPIYVKHKPKYGKSSKILNIGNSQDVLVTSTIASFSIIV